MEQAKYRAEITNEDGSVDVYETDGINKPTKNGVPFEPLPPQQNNVSRKLPTTIKWSEPINTGTITITDKKNNP